MKKKSVEGGGSLPAIVVFCQPTKGGQPMTGSANETRETPAVEPAAEPIGPKQLREFDAKLLQQVPDLSKDEMQHLIEHPEEFRARLHYFGLKTIESICPASFCAGLGSQMCQWNDFYADVFNVAPDFSRIRFPDFRVYTYTTPIFVAPRLALAEIFEAIEQHGVKFLCHSSLLSMLACFSKDIGRPHENYVASFSESVVEEPPRSIKDEHLYRRARMTLREYLLWVAFCLYRLKKEKVAPSCVTKLISSCIGSHSLFGTMIGTFQESPYIKFEKRENLETCPEAEYSMSIFDCELKNFFPASYHDGVRRVKLWKSLPQI